MLSTISSGIGLNEEMVSDNKILKIENFLKSNNTYNDGLYEPKNITPKNASYHESAKEFTIEWWYFEGIFDNGLNAVVNIIVASKSDIGFCITHLNIFHNNNQIDLFSKRKIQSFNIFEGSESFPDITINGKQTINFDQEEYNVSKRWIYEVKYGLNRYAVDLRFVGLAPGWEGDVLGGSYGPVLPIADVKGEIKIENQTINVVGLGYHEHAYNISLPIWEWGWYWGKIVGDKTSFTWGKMMNSYWSEEGRAGVFSEINSSYININPDNIDMKLLNIKFHDRHFIPTKFVFNITDRQNNIFVNVTMVAVQIHHLPLGFLNYWRYVLSVNGEIIYKNNREQIHNKTQIMELMRFR
jgi:hypothetical protein